VRVVDTCSHDDDTVTLPEETGSNGEYKLSSKAMSVYFYSTMLDNAGASTVFIRIIHTFLSTEIQAVVRKLQKFRSGD